MAGGLDESICTDAAGLVGLLRAQTDERERRLAAGGSWTLTESIEHARLAAQVTLRCLQLAQGSGEVQPGTPGARVLRGSAGVTEPRTAGGHLTGAAGTHRARTDATPGRGPAGRPVQRTVGHGARVS